MSDDGQLSMNFGDLTDLSGAIGKAHSSVDSLKTDIQSAAQNLQAAWSGSAGESWTTVQGKWNSACDNLITALHTLSTTVLSNAEEGARVEAQNRGLFDGI
jgi:WXG100 family type VII secretion target